MKKVHALNHCIKGLLSFEDRFDVVTADMTEWICERLAWHKLLPLAASINMPHIPKCNKLVSIFENVVLRNAIREKKYELQTRQLFQRLTSASISYIPYKGPFWGQQLYPEYGWRHIGDIDLLISPKDARKASALLQEMGYVPEITKGTEDDIFEARGALTMQNHPDKADDVPVQIHWELMPSPRFLKRQYLPSDTFFQDTTAARWKGMTFQIPRPEVQFLYYILHATCQHQFMRFAHVMVMKHFIDKFVHLDWPAIHELADSQNALVPLYYGLKFIHAFSALPQPAAALMKCIRPSLGNRLSAAILQPGATLLFTQKRGKIRRNLFRLALSQ